MGKGSNHVVFSKATLMNTYVWTLLHTKAKADVEGYHGGEK